MTKSDPNLEDKNILASYEGGEWQSVGDLQREIRRYQKYAQSWIEDNALVFLTLPADDFERLKRKAKQAGIPYQTLLTNRVHQFVTSAT